MSENAADPDHGTRFWLAYELRPDDLEQLVSDQARAGRKNLRARVVTTIIPLVVLAAPLTAVTVALDLPSVVHGSSGAPSWMYAIDGILWYLVIVYVRARWQLSPKRVARRAWQNHAHGRFGDRIDRVGLTAIGPDGAWRTIPWANFREVDENDGAFRLIDHDDEIRAVLPKRGLASPESVPALREFLIRSVTAHDERDQTSPGSYSGPGYPLAYDLQPGDLLAVNRKELAGLRERTEARLAGSLLGLGVAGWQVAVHGVLGLPGWLAVLGGICAVQFSSSLRTMWRQTPRRYARRAYQLSSDRQGRNLDIVDQRGVTSTDPTGEKHGLPWSAVAAVTETDDTFGLADRRGVLRKVLLKRAVPRSDLVPELRNFIDRSVAAAHTATEPPPDSAVSQPGAEDRA